MSFVANHPWKNMHETESTVSARYYEPRNRRADGSIDPRNAWEPGLDALLGIVRDAEHDGRRVRALGGLWSLSPVAMLPDYVIDTTNLTERTIHLPKGALLPAAAQKGSFVFAQSGVKVVDLHEDLVNAGFDLPTCGASNGQTLGGAIATGTHGAAVEVGAMQDYVVGLHLIGANGRHAWIERASRPVASDAFVAMLGAERVSDDALFAAALVSFGNFGVVHAFMLQVTPAFSLEQFTFRVDYEVARQAFAKGALDLGPLGMPGSVRPFHVELVVDPYNRAKGAAGVSVRVMYKRPFQPQAPSPGGVTSSPSRDLIASIAGLLDAFPGPVDHVTLTKAVPLYLASTLPLLNGVVSSPARIFGDTSLKPGGVSMELGFALTDLGRAVELLADTAEAHLYAGALAMRFVKASSATLAFTRFSPITCTIETASVATRGTLAALDAFWKELDAAGIPYTLHWGQKLRAEAKWVRSAYGGAVKAWLDARRDWLPTPAARRLFSSDLLDQLDLST